MLANSYSGDKRETMLGLILGSVICGEMAGLVYGGCAYDLFGKADTFLIIGTISLIGGGK